MKFEDGQLQFNYTFDIVERQFGSISAYSLEEAIEKIEQDPYFGIFDSEELDIRWETLEVEQDD